MRRIPLKSTWWWRERQDPVHLQTTMAPTHNDVVDDSILPGTTHLVDLLGTMHAAHDASHKDIILVPTPSDDPDDPLNWSRRRKNLHMFSIFMYARPQR